MMRSFPLLSHLFLAVLLAVFSSRANSTTFKDSLTNGASLAENFIYWSLSPTSNSPEEDGCSFEANPLFGAELITPVGQTMQAAWALRTPLPTSQSWTVTARVHIDSFTNSQNFPYYGVGVSILRYSAEPPAGVPAERVNIGMSRETLSSTSGADLANYISGSFYTGGAFVHQERSPLGQWRDAFVRAVFDANSGVLSLSFSTNGSSFTPLSGASYNIRQDWNLGGSDELMVVVSASSIPSSWEAGSIDYAVTSGQIYVRDLELAFTDAPQGRFLLRLEYAPDLRGVWETVPLSFDQLNAEGEVVLTDFQTSSGFYRLNLSPRP